MRGDANAPGAPVNVSAHVIYRRPSERQRLLSALARLGVFAHEAPHGVPGAICRVQPPRFSVLVTDREDRFRTTAETIPTPIIAVVPHASDEAPFSSAGMAVVNEDMTDDELLQALARVARIARAHSPAQADPTITT